MASKEDTCGGGTFNPKSTRMWNIQKAKVEHWNRGGTFECSGLNPQWDALNQLLEHWNIHFPKSV